ncbi:cAMP-binding domain of CRP or a regulatory subunit of cAMP-dependent protein kinases [Dyadobacter sp. SG02]|uniref:Crp/Fnr family transcriptional regulator n=1 Tax=Dyadobacter sp. SG02 TaxID=1855291 RepID=UPI0008BDDF25|nr:Crp/Fnr family transcriptional regulator [Dyadobacter sp. SG02]SEJ23010.1 cAMP-binding domain of CRP or a regulatory subunit of cAMP-dependent protein kinases [Dyadobacter sp. SG02]
MNSLTPEREKLVDFITKAYPMPMKTASDIAGRFYTVRFGKGDFLLKEGSVSNEYVFLTEGYMRSFATDPDGNDITTSFHGPQQVVFEIASFFHRIPSRENIQALTPCTGIAITYATLNELFHALPEFREFGRSILVNGFSNLKSRMLSTITETAEARYLQLLQTSPDIFQHAPLRTIATYLGITDTSLSRIRKEISGK